MLATLATTTHQTGASIGNVLALVVFVAGFYFFQRWLRGRVSPHRRARWAEEERLEKERLDHPADQPTDHTTDQPTDGRHRDDRP